jgi:acyl dehydratase
MLETKMRFIKPVLAAAALAAFATVASADESTMTTNKGQFGGLGGAAFGVITIIFVTTLGATSSGGS